MNQELAQPSCNEENELQKCQDGDFQWDQGKLKIKEKKREGLTPATTIKLKDIGLQSRFTFTIKKKRAGLN